ncbi:killer cell lectin-like receptor subfamily B member 1B allele B [Emydura macquarii macquarii]|uniref:killer cell lectin-like receptor subfamily B member 1B allele B n=1 Tax=Emydura macquarii macquarii TaxID=1129001 RepID=UPI00352AAF95
MSENITYAVLNLSMVAGPSQRLVKSKDTEADPVYAEVKAKSLDTNSLDSCTTGDQRWCTRGRVLALTAVTGLLLVIGVTLVLVCLTTTQEPAELQMSSTTTRNTSHKSGLTTTQEPAELQMSSTTTRNTSHKSGCPPGWKQHEKNCYFFSQTENKDWNSSRKECAKNDSDLVIINNREEWEFLNTTSRAEQATVYYFLGLTYLETKRIWEWYNNTELNTNIFNVTTAPDTSDYLCAVLGRGKVETAHCSRSSTTKYMCQKAVA